jgi:CBS domain-containing protein
MQTESAVKARHVMTPDPICCLPTDTAQDVAALLRDHDVGCLPVVKDHLSRKLMGIITDRDLCCAVVASGVESKAILIRRLLSKNPVKCHLEDDLESCIAAMERYQVRRLPVVDDRGRCVGIISQADLALRAKPPAISKLVTEVSKMRERRASVA